jgi:hypothetical protein
MARKKTTPVQIVRNRATWLLRSLNSSSRVLPEFVIIGAAKGGTTSLFNYLASHPQVAAPLKKEVHYFDRNYAKGPNWYRMHFPTKTYMQKNANGKRYITGEASPYYLSHPLAAARLKDLIPNARLIVLLRNPVDRALSNYQHMVRLGIETESLEAALAMEADRIRGEREKMIADPNYYSFNHHHYSYTERGIYWKELQSWFALFPREQFLIFDSGSFYTDPGKVFTDTQQFIGIEKWEPEQYKTFNSGGDYQPIDQRLRAKLLEYFRPHNEKLFEMLGTRFNWDT